MSPEKRKTIIFLAFVVVTILTAVLVLLANIGIFGEDVRNGEFAKWGVGVVLAEIVGATVLVFKQSFSPSINAVVNLQFPLPSRDIDLDPERCSLQLRTSIGKTITKKVTPAIGVGGWHCSIPTDVTSSNDLLTLELNEINGRKWKVRPFLPYITTQDAIQVI